MVRRLLARDCPPHRSVALVAIAGACLLAVPAATATGEASARLEYSPMSSTSPSWAGGTAQVKIFLARGAPGPRCARVFPVWRTVRTPAVLRGAMEALLRGPTAAERRRGYGGWFSQRTAGLLRSVNLSNGIAEIDFDDFRRIIPNASSSCGSALLLAQLNRTAKQFPTVSRAVYSFNGSRRAFYEWLQLSPPRAF